MPTTTTDASPNGSAPHDGPAATAAAGAEPVDFAATFAALPGIDLLLAPDAPRYTMLAATDARLAATMTTREGTLGRPLFDVFPDANPANAEPTGVGNLRASLDRVLRTRAPHRMARQRYDLQRADGTWEVRWWEPINVPVLGPDGGVRYLLHRVEDVTARVHAEGETARLGVALEAERERLRLLVRHMPVPLALHVGPEHRHALVNDAYRRLAGGREVLGLTPREAFPELAGQGIHERFDEVYATGESWVAPETPLRYDRSGTGRLEEAWLDIRYVPLRDPGPDGPAGVPGPVTAILAFAVDVTEQVRARQAVEAALVQRTAEAGRAWADLAASEARFRDAFAQGPAAVAVLEGPDAVYRLVSATYEAWAAHGPLAGRAFLEALPELRGSPLDRAHREVYATGEPRTLTEVPLAVDRDGDGVAEAYVYTVHYAPLRDAAGAVYAVASLVVDVTEQVRVRRLAERAQAEAEAARQAAEAANAAKSTFLSTMSHELRTPLNAIAGYAELLALGVRGPLSAEQQADVERIRRANRHMSGLVEAVLSFARVEAGHVEYHLETVPLAPLITDLEALVGPQFAAKGLAYDHDACGPETPDRPHVVHADAEKVRQILLNLLTNAAKFTAPGGRVRLACETDAAAGVVRVRVSDTGRGIAREELERVFEPFVQVDRHRTHESQQGIGLGLAISRDLARGMGGDLTAESVAGVGSTFTVALRWAGAAHATDRRTEG